MSNLEDLDDSPSIHRTGTPTTDTSNQNSGHHAGAKTSTASHPSTESPALDSSLKDSSTKNSLVKNSSHQNSVQKIQKNLAQNSTKGHDVSSPPTGQSPHKQFPPVPSPPDENSEVGFLPVLKNINFLALWGGQVFSQLADKVYLVLMIAIISSQFQAGGQSISGWVSALMIVFTIPAILFGFAAGVFVDRWPKKLVLVLTNLLRGGLVFGLPLLMWASTDWQAIYNIPVGFFLLLGVTFLVSTLTQFFAPAEQAIIPLLVDKKHLLSANSLYTTTMMASVIVGFALGEPCLELADDVMRRFNANAGNGKEIFVGLCYVIAGLTLIAIRPTRPDVSEPSESHIWADMKDGLQYLRGHDKVRSALIQLVILFSVFAALAVLAVRLAELIPVLDSDQFGFLLAAAGVGMAVGATLIGQFGQRFRRSLLSLIGSIGMTICLTLLSFVTEQLWPSLIIIGCLGGFAAMVGIPLQTTIQAETPETMRGKVFGLQNNAVNIALSLPLALAGVAETFFGLPTVLLALSVIILTGGLLTWYSSRMGSA